MSRCPLWPFRNLGAKSAANRIFKIQYVIEFFPGNLLNLDSILLSPPTNPLAVRSEANDAKDVAARLMVDQDKVRPDVAVAVISPLTGELVISMFRFKHKIVGQKVNDGKS